MGEMHQNQHKQHVVNFVQKQHVFESENDMQFMPIFFQTASNLLGQNFVTTIHEARDRVSQRGTSVVPRSNFSKLENTSKMQIKYKGFPVFCPLLQLVGKPDL